MSPSTLVTVAFTIASLVLAVWNAISGQWLFAGIGLLAIVVSLVDEWLSRNTGGEWHYVGSAFSLVALLALYYYVPAALLALGQAEIVREVYSQNPTNPSMELTRGKAAAYEVEAYAHWALLAISGGCYWLARIGTKLYESYVSRKGKPDPKGNK